MVLAGLAFTFFSSPNITLTPAFVAGFHNGPCWLGLHLLLLTEHHPHTGFCCWLSQWSLLAWPSPSSPHRTSPSHRLLLLAFTMVLAGLAFTFFSSPNITLTPAFVAGLTLVLMRQRPGRVNTPVFFTSFAAIAARLFRTCEHSLFFMLCSVAMAPINPDLVITELLFFMVV